MSVDDVLAQRGAVYGDFLQQARISIQLLEIMCVTPAWTDGFVGERQDMQEALMMIAVKIARILNGDPDYVDNWDDIAGYATLVANRLRAEQATASARK